MSENIFTIECPDLPSDAHVVAFRGTEALNQPYSIDIGIRTSDTGFNHDDAVLSRATLRIDEGGGAAPYLIHGLFAAVELVHEHDGKMLYRGTLVPKLWQLSLSRHSNIWTDTDIVTVITEVLTWSGLDNSEFEFRLDGSYPKREVIAQYKETNLAFISRWMERLGMYYFFEHGGDREKLVIVDGKSFSDDTPKPTVKYAPLSEGDEMANEAFDRFRSKTQALPAAVELWDYDYLNPTLDVKGSHSITASGTTGEVSNFGDDNFLTPGEGNKLAAIRAQQYLARQKVFNGRGRVFNLYSGFPFQLEDHPRSDLTDKTYLVTAIEHQGNQSADSAYFKEILNIDIDEIYICEVTAIFGDVQYRAPSVHSWPRIEGYESATVCGEADSEYAQIDEHGRYHVRILFDESDLGDGKASAWVRMQQPYGGTNEGFHFPLVKNTEVLLWFMGGDPDRPVIAGVAPNVLTPSPVTNNNHTTNIIQTVNLNLIEIEDILNGQYIYVYCPVENTWIHMGVLKNEFNLVLNTEGHVHFEFGGLQLIDIALTLTENVKLDVTFNYDQNWIVNVKADNNITIDCDLNLFVKGDVKWTILGDWIGTIIGDVTFMIGGDETYNILGDQTYLILGDQTNLILGDQNITIMGDQNISITGKQNVDVASDWKWNVLGHEIQIKSANSTELTVGLKNEVFIGVKNSVFVGGQINATLAMMMELKAAAAMSLTVGAFLNLKASNELNLTGGNHINIDGGLRMGVHGGIAISMFAGIKMNLEAALEIKLVGGPDLEIAPIEIHL